MEGIKTLVNWAYNLLNQGSYLLSWFLQPMDFYVFKFTPLELLSVVGLTAYLSIAVVKWAIN